MAEVRAGAGGSGPSAPAQPQADLTFQPFLLLKLWLLLLRSAVILIAKALLRGQGTGLHGSPLAGQWSVPPKAPFWPQKAP